MSISAFPAFGAETWTEVATSSPTSGTTVSFTGLGAAKKFRIVGHNITYSSSSSLSLTVNNDSGANYNGIFNANSTGDIAASNLNLASGQTKTSFDLTFEAANQPVWKQGSGWAAGSTNGYNIYNVFWASTASIDRFDLTSTQAFTGGTIKVFAAN